MKICIVRQEGRREKHECENIILIGSLLQHPLLDNPGMCPDLDLNQQPSNAGDYAQPTKPHQVGPELFLK